MSTETFNAKIKHVTKNTSEWASESSTIDKGILCIELTTDGNTYAKVGDGTKTFANLPYLKDGSFKISDYFTKTETNTAISSAISALGNIITVKGVKSSASQLPSSDNKVGDLWFVGTAGGSTDSFSEYIWTSSNTWEFLGRVQTEVDLSGYTTTQRANEIENAVNGVADRVTDLESDAHTHTNKAVLDGITAVESALSDTSTNPVQTKVVKAAIDAQAKATSDLTAVVESNSEELGEHLNKITELDSNAHKHGNKGVLDATTASFTTEQATKLEGIETGANKTVVDDAMSATSTNPVQNKVAKAAIDAVSTALTTHTEKTSGNPHNVTKSDIGLGNVENKSSATIRGELTEGDVRGALGYIPTNAVYATCETEARVSDKTAFTADYLDTSFVLTAGVVVYVKFTNGNNATKPTLNVNGTGAKAIYKDGSALPYYTYGTNGNEGTQNLTIKSGGLYQFIYDGTNWVINGVDSNTVYNHPVYTELAGKPVSNIAVQFGGSFPVSQPVCDGYGHITEINTRLIKISDDAATTSTDGLMSATDKTTLDSIKSAIDNNTAYTHPTSGVTPGTYRRVVVNDGGHVTSADNATITIAEGGTGATTENGAQYNLLKDIIETTTEIDDDTKFAFKYITPSSGKGVLYTKNASLLWDYIRSKITSSLFDTGYAYYNTSTDGKKWYKVADTTLPGSSGININTQSFFIFNGGSSQGCGVLTITTAYTESAVTSISAKWSLVDHKIAELKDNFVVIGYVSGANIIVELWIGIQTGWHSYHIRSVLETSRSAELNTWNTYKTSNGQASYNSPDGAVVKSSSVTSAVYVDNTTPTGTSETAYNIPYFASDSVAGPKQLLHNSAFRYKMITGTPETEGRATLYLGNATPKGTDGNETGRLTMFDSNGKYGNLQSSQLTENRAWALPDKTGIIAVTSDIDNLRNDVFATPVARIESNTDLNTIVTAGAYVCPNATVAETLTNCPIAYSFRLEVKYLSVGSSRYVQTLYPNMPSKVAFYTRRYTSTGWLDWTLIGVNDEVTETGKLPVSGAAVVAYIDNVILNGSW